MSIKLIKASYEYQDLIVDMLKEWIDYNNNHPEANTSPASIFKNDYHNFDYYINSLDLKNPKPGLVEDSTFFALDVERNKMVGAINIRHKLNDYLLNYGGHIGDGIRPSERKKGYATKIIGLALKECQKLNIDKVLLVCDKDNIGSAKSIKNNGAILENEIVKDGKVDISVTTFVPAPAEVTTEVKAEEVNQNVEKSIPLAAAKFEPSGLKFKNDVTISIPNPIPGITFADADMILTYQNPDTGEWGDAKDNDGNVIKNVSSTTENGAVTAYTADVDHFSAYAIENKVYSKISNETVTTNILGQASRDNSENAKAVTGIELKYKEKSGWDYDKNDAGLVAEVKSQLGAGASAEDTKTVNAMVAFMKTRMFSLMGSVSGITETERVYNTVNVNGYTTMSYTCYAKARTTTLTANVKFNGQNKTVSITATRYTGTDHQYKTVTYNPTHSGGKGGSI